MIKNFLYMNVRMVDRNIKMFDKFNIEELICGLEYIFI